VLRFAVLDAATVRRELAGQICRCTGYVGIVAAILQAHAAISPSSETVG
jgi:carbon-monoxide dehydrogenase small subunit